MPFYSRMKRFRKDAGLSREQVAKLMGRSARTIERWEQGRSEVPLNDMDMFLLLTGKKTIERIRKERERE